MKIPNQVQHFHVYRELPVSEKMIPTWFGILMVLVAAVSATVAIFLSSTYFWPQ